ncbi:MAG: heavy-metal-associated domain-containing protein, partial [Betaproteobacteria bacterium]
MKTSTVEVAEMVSSLSAAGVGRQLEALPGVHHADVNYVAGSATLHYDESKVTLAAIQQSVKDCGYHCRGEMVPAHVCNAANRSAGAPDRSQHAGHASHAGHQPHAEPGKSTANDKAEMMHD